MFVIIIIILLLTLKKLNIKIKKNEIHIKLYLTNPQGDFGAIIDSSPISRICNFLILQRENDCSSIFVTQMLIPRTSVSCSLLENNENS